MVKGLMCNVYKCGLGDCTNGGLSSNVDKAILIPPEGEEFDDCRVFDADEETPVFKVVKRILTSYRTSKEYVYAHAEPVEPSKKGMVGYMAGGNILFSCDSRWKKITGVDYPIQIHDRQETSEDYKEYSA